MSNRLESLNLKPAKSALKFKPKVVARKSKEDRDKTAADVKVEEPSRSQFPNRQRGSVRGRGRGRGASYVGTHLVSSGPFSHGSVGMGGGQTTSKTGLTSDRIYGASELTNSILSSLKVNARDRKPSEADDSDDDDPTKINMSKAYAFDESETVLFPVRPQKDHVGASKASADISVESSAVPSAAPSATPSRGQTLEPEGERAISIKSESGDSVKNEADVSGSVATSESATESQTKAPSQDPLEVDEHDKMLDDQRTIVDLLTARLGQMSTDSVQDPNYLLFQIPQITKLEKEESDLSNDAMDIDKPEQSLSKSPFAKTQQNFLGNVGQLNFHASGKISITLADSTVLECSKGTSPSFLEELYVLDSFQASRDPASTEEDENSLHDADGLVVGGKIFRLGKIDSKIIATPTF